jgi:hypothetical protein
MCLRVDHHVKLEEDMLVYKVQQNFPKRIVLKEDDFGRKILHKLELGMPFCSTYTCHCPDYNVISTANGSIDEIHKTGTGITSGYFHFYETKDCAVLKSLYFSVTIKGRVFRIIECKIPKGTIVYFGKHDDVAAKHAIFQEKTVGVYIDGEEVFSVSDS